MYAMIRVDLNRWIRQDEVDPEQPDLGVKRLAEASALLNKGILQPATDGLIGI